MQLNWKSIIISLGLTGFCTCGFSPFVFMLGLIPQQQTLFMKQARPPQPAANYTELSFPYLSTKKCQKTLIMAINVFALCKVEALKIIK